MDFLWEGGSHIQRLQPHVLTLAVASQDNEMAHELAHPSFISPKNHVGGYYSFHGANGDNFRSALLFSIFTCLIYVLEPVTDNKGYRRIQFIRLEGEKHRSV